MIALGVLVATPVTGAGGAPPASVPAPGTMCQRYFFNVTLTLVQQCAAYFADKGLTLTAFADASNSGQGPFSGSFEPGPPRTIAKVENVDTLQGCVGISDMLNGPYDQMIVVRGAHEPACEFLQPYVSGVDQNEDFCAPLYRNRFLSYTGREAAKGFATKHLVIYRNLGAGIGDEAYILMDKSNPDDTVAIYCPSPVQRATFEQRARAKGYLPYRYDGQLEVWRRHVYSDVQVRKNLTQAAFGPINAGLTAKMYRLVQLKYSGTNQFFAVWAK